MSPQCSHRPSNSMADCGAFRSNARAQSSASPVMERARGLRGAAKDIVVRSAESSSWFAELLAELASQQLAHFVVRQRIPECDAFGHARGAQAALDELLQFSLTGPSVVGPCDHGDADRLTPFRGGHRECCGVRDRRM